MGTYKTILIKLKLAQLITDSKSETFISKLLENFYTCPDQDSQLNQKVAVKYLTQSLTKILTNLTGQ